MKLNKIGVIGAGTMGTGVTADLVYHGKDVVLLDINESVLRKAEQVIMKILKTAPLWFKKKPGIPFEESMKRIIFTNSISSVNCCDFIIENITEDWEIKRKLYSELDRICPAEVCFGVNTSCIPITQVAGVTKREKNIIGMHIMNPSILKPVVEVIRGFHTSDQTVAKVEKLLSEIGKEMILVNDCAGFVSNRISHLFMNEAAFVVQDGVALPQQVDTIFKKCYSHTMGPLETADLIGLDTVVNSLNVLYNSYQDTKYRCCPLLKKMVAAGMLGKKSGKGFYEY